MSSIKDQATNSVFWSAVERFSVQGVQFIASIVIARMLLPSDYGLIAMLSIFMALAQTCVDSGFANALIQKKERTEVDFDTVFYFNIVISFFIYLFLYVSAPSIASFFDEPTLTLITRCVSLGFVINSFGIVQQAKLTIELNFKKMAYASLLAVLFSGVGGIVLACQGWGVWALIWQALGNNLLRVLFMWIFSHWHPQWRFSMDSFRGLFAFGSKLLFSSLLHTLYTNLYTLIIGKFFAAAELGYYNRSFTLAQFPSVNLANIAVRAIYPIQCRIQDDVEQFRLLFLKYTRMACYIVFPIMLTMCALAKPLVLFLLTDKWLAVVPLLRILCIAFMWDPIMKINNTVIQAKGRSDYFFHAEIIKKILAFIILFTTIPFGVAIMCVGLIVYAFVDMGVIMFYSQKVTGISILKQCQQILPVFVLSLITAIAVYGVTFFSLPAIVTLLLGVLCSFIFYLLLSKLFRFDELSIIYSLIHKKS